MWIKKVRRRKLQSILIVLIILVCAMLMTSSLVIMTSWGKPYEDLTKECKSPILKLYLYDPGIENGINVKEKFEQLEEVQAARVVEYSYLRDKVYHENKSIDYFFDLVSYDARLHDNIRIIKGTGNDLGEKECLIPATLASNENIAIGDQLQIGDKQFYQVKGIYADPYNMSISFDIEIIVPKLPNNLEIKHYISAFTDQKITGNELLDLYRENNDKILEGRAVTLEERIGNNQMSDKILGGMLLAVSAVVLLVSGIMIQYMIRSTLVSEKKSIAIYKMIGYENRDIVGIYMRFYIFLVSIGSVIGAWLSKFISDSFTKGTFQNLGIRHSSGIITAGVACAGVIIIYVSIQVYVVLKRTKKVKPIEVFRGEDIGKDKMKGVKQGIVNFSPLAMAARMMRREKKNTVIIILTCIVSAYCVNFAATTLTLMQGMRDNNYYWIGFDKHDVSMESLDLSRFDETVEKLYEIEEVERVIPTTTDVSVSIEWKKGIGDTIVSSMIYESFEGINMAVLEGRNPRYSNEIAIGNAIAEKLNKNIGDYMDIYFNGNQKVSLLICGTYQSFYNMGKSCRLLGDTLKENDVDFQYSEGSVYLKKGYDADDFLKKYNAMFEQMAKLIDRKNKYVNIMDMINGPQMMAIKPFMAMALLLGGLNIIAIVYLKNKDNSKIHSIYKAIGYSANHLLAMNMIYIFIIASASIIITVPVFILLFPKTMILSMSLFGFKEYIVTYRAGIMIFSNLVALLIYMISGLLSSKVLYDNPISDLTCE